VTDIIQETLDMNGVSAEWSEIQDSAYMAKFDRATLQSTLDGIIDYVEGVKFYDLTLTVTGELVDGPLFEGTDTITVIKK
jgi:hypothetical protein